MELKCLKSGKNNNPRSSGDRYFDPSFPFPPLPLQQHQQRWKSKKIFKNPANRNPVSTKQPVQEGGETSDQWQEPDEAFPPRRRSLDPSSILKLLKQNEARSEDCRTKDKSRRSPDRPDFFFFFSCTKSLPEDYSFHPAIGL